MEPVLDDFNENEATDTDQEPQTDTDRTDGEETTTTPSQSRSSSIRPQPHISYIDNDVDVFDGYSFKGRHSVLIDDDDDDGGEETDSLSGEGEGGESILEGEDENGDDLSILGRLEEEAAQIGEPKPVGEGEGEEDGGVDGVSVSGEIGLVDEYGVEPKTPEARHAAALPPVEEVVVPTTPVVEEVVSTVEEKALPPVEEEVVPHVEEVVPPVEEVVVAPVEEVVVPPAAEDMLPLVPEVDETVADATKVEESQAEPKVEEESSPEVSPTHRRSVEELDDSEPKKEVCGEIVSTQKLNGSAHVIDAKESYGQRTTPPPTTPPPKARQLQVIRAGRNRKEKSGVFALDRYLSDAAIDEATEAERDDEDDDWDFVEKADGEDRNGAKGPSLFARGVVDRYRLAVFRKASIPSTRSGMRSVTGMSNASETTAVSESPSPSQHRGRTPGLTFRKNPRQFLRPKSPPSSFSAKTARSLSQSASSSNIISAASTSSSGGARLLSASHSVGSTFAFSPSLKSKESAMSVGAQSQSSDQSANGASVVFVDAADAADTIRGSPLLTTKGQVKGSMKGRKLRRYKHNAEKVFSLFSSPRQAS